MKEYRTIDFDKVVTHELIINKSRFIGYAKNVCDVENANKFISDIKQKHESASHNCIAYIVGENMQSMKYSDDGEPSGTAGVPMLDVLKKSGLTDIVVVCTRYFGGTKLGAGGLVRAYSSCVSETLKCADLIRCIPCNIYNVICDYDIWARIEKKVLDANAMLRKVEYMDKITLEIGLKDEHFEDVNYFFSQALKTDHALKFLKQDYVYENIETD